MAGITWLEVIVRADSEAAEAICEFFGRYGQGGAVLEFTAPSSDTETRDPEQGLVTVKTYLDPADSIGRHQLEEALWHLSQIYPFGSPEFKELSEEDWATVWRKDYHVQHVGQHIVIVPSWLEYVPQPDDVVLFVDPGLAFGTGLHPSTRLCLQALEETPLCGKAVLDLGTGSGILAIYAAKVGARRVIALDIDRMAVKTAEENAHQNAVAAKVSVGYGSLGMRGYELVEETSASFFPGPFNIIVVNILAETVAHLTPAMVAHLQDEGRVIASGIIEAHEEIVKAAWADAGLEIRKRYQEGDWVALVGSKA